MKKIKIWCDGAVKGNGKTVGHANDEKNRCDELANEAIAEFLVSEKK